MRHPYVCPVLAFCALDLRSEADPLIDCTLRVELRCNIGTADDVHDATSRDELVRELAQRLLARAKYNRIHAEMTRVPAMHGGQPLRADAFVAQAGHHVDGAGLQTRAVNPAGRLPESRAEFRFLALKQVYFAAGLFDDPRAKAPASLIPCIDAPFGIEFVGAQAAA